MEKEEKYKKFSFNLEIYNCTIHFGIPKDIGLAFYNISKEEDDVSTFAGLFFSKDILDYYILVNKEMITHSYINHEIYHCVSKILRDRGVKDEEASAYLFGHIVTKVYEFLENNKVKVKIKP